MSAQYEDWTDWAGDHPEQAEADLRRDRERAERRTSSSTTPEFEAKLLSISKKLVETGAIIKRDPLAAAMPFKPFAPYSPKCDTLGHEYNFGICLDCEKVDPAFEPSDDMIEADYLNRTFAA